VLLNPLTAAPLTVGYLTGRWMERYGHRVAMLGDQVASQEAFHVVMAAMVGLAGLASLGMVTRLKEN